ncbi:MAG: hypothetical protein WAL50_21010 [Kineosporiaceae bacterium]
MDQGQHPEADGAGGGVDGSGAAPMPEVLAALARSGADISVLQGVSTVSLTDAEHGEALAAAYRLRAR